MGRIPADKTAGKPVCINVQPGLWFKVGPIVAQDSAAEPAQFQQRRRSMDETSILVDVQAGYRVITLNRPAWLNASTVMHATKFEFIINL